VRVKVRVRVRERGGRGGGGGWIEGEICLPLQGAERGGRGEEELR